MIIDKDGKIFGKINIIDLLVIILIIGCIGFIGYKLTNDGVSVVPSQQSKEYVMKFYVEQVEDFVVDGMETGETIYDDSKNMPLGNITNIDIGNSIEFNPDAEGILVSSPKTGYSSMEITSEINASPFENGIIISGNKYGVGHSLTVRAGKSICFMRISGIDEKGAEN